MGKVNVLLKVLVIVVITITLCSCRQKKPIAGDNNPDTIKTESVLSESMVEVIVEDSTGEILGVKANEVGDFYIINPGDEQMIPKEGHSVKTVLEKELDVNN